VGASHALLLQLQLGVPQFLAGVADNKLIPLMVFVLFDSFSADTECHRANQYLREQVRFVQLPLFLSSCHGTREWYFPQENCGYLHTACVLLCFPHVNSANNTLLATAVGADQDGDTFVYVTHVVQVQAVCLPSRCLVGTSLQFVALHYVWGAQV
jgi:hypothetical protein